MSTTQFFIDMMQSTAIIVLSIGLLFELKLRRRQ